MFRAGHDWWWVPIVAPCVGGVLGGWLYDVFVGHIFRWLEATEITTEVGVRIERGYTAEIGDHVEYVNGAMILTAVTALLALCDAPRAWQVESWLSTSSGARTRPACRWECQGNDRQRGAGSSSARSRPTRRPFVLENLPFGRYQLRLESAGFAPYATIVEVRTAVPPLHIPH